jgi:hypothetical protein
MKDSIAAFSPRLKTVRTARCYHWFHLDGSRCHTPHDLCTEEHLAPVLAWEDVSEKLVMTIGRNELLDGVFNEAPAGFSWYCGLVNNASFTAYAAGDTLASHAGWLEGTPYAGNRPAWTKNGAASSGAMSNSSSKASYSINATLTVRGAFLASVNTGTSGILYGAGDFSGTRDVESGDTLTLQVDLSVTAS